MEEESHRFIADVHLGKLAKALRMAGFDVLYRNNYTNKELEILAAMQGRILLSRNPAFAKENTFKSFMLKSEDWFVQICDVINCFELSGKLKPFTRCLVCNGHLQPIAKEKIEAQLQENTRKYFDAFWQCVQCNRIYWKGSHYERMERLIKQLKNAL
jgi:uncharacterized protein